MSTVRARRLALPALCALAALLFGALGVWQIERLTWKRDLIARVNARLAAPPAPLPPRSFWDVLAAKDTEYRRVRVAGRFRHEAETLVDALTERGPGFWVLTPLETPQGLVLINRGFVPPGRRLPSARREGQVAGSALVTGLMRVTEPGGRFLRPNEPPRDRWYSRDVAAIAAARGLAGAAPFFIDADAAPNPGGWPVGGMTVIRFRNTHLVYALTWFALMSLSLAGLVLAVRSPQQRD